MQFHASIIHLAKIEHENACSCFIVVVTAPRREKIKRKAERKYLVLVLSQTPGLRVNIVIERVKADAIGTSIARTVFGRSGIEIRFRWCVVPVPSRASTSRRQPPL